MRKLLLYILILLIFLDFSLAVNLDYPQFSSYAVNETIIGLNEYAKFNVSVTDITDTINYVNGTINEISYDLLQGAGSEWYFDWECLVSDNNVDFTFAGANDTGSPSNWNQTIITGVSVEAETLV